MRVPNPPEARLATSARTSTADSAKSRKQRQTFHADETQLLQGNAVSFLVR